MPGLTVGAKVLFKRGTLGTPCQTLAGGDDASDGLDFLFPQDGANAVLHNFHCIPPCTSYHPAGLGHRHPDLKDYLEMRVAWSCLAFHLLRTETSHLILHLNQKESQRDRRFRKSDIFLPCADGNAWRLWFHRGLRPNQHRGWRRRAGYRRSTKAHLGIEWMRPRVAEECAEAQHRWSLVIGSWRMPSFRRWPCPPGW